jgi:AmmeMemoRadiSam system protein A
VELLGDREQETLLTLARRALEARVRGTPAPARQRGGLLDEPRGAFVTIHNRGELRGCLGRIEVDRPLADTVADLAAVVADSDPRFEPVSSAELSRLEVEVSVLTPEREVTAIEEIEVGRHGLIVEHGARRGLLLPQVAVEQGWSRERFLEHTCVKAGLPPDAWRRGARIFLFEAQVFSEGPSAAPR